MKTGFLPTLVLAAFLSVAKGAEPAEAVDRAKKEGEPQPEKKIAELRLRQRTFTFVRIKYSAGKSRTRWATDYPDADLNFSARFGKVTGLPVDPDGKVLEFTDPDLRKYPFAYISEAGGLTMSAEEARALRAYLLGGGFLMADDFWGEEEWESLATEMKKAFPDARIVDLPLEHPIFHCFYQLKEKPQVPNVRLGVLSQHNGGITWERKDAKEAHRRGLTDGNGRLMGIFCHNTDLGDGWEREGEDAYYYREFSLKKAYPLGINIVLHTLSR